MIKNVAVVSGSFILQMILNEKWENSDIDIFIPAKGVNLKNNILGDTSDLEEFFSFHLCPNHHAGFEYEGTTGPATQIKHIREYTKCIKSIGFTQNLTGLHDANSSIQNPASLREASTIIQTILINVEPNFSSIKKYINSSFDLDICKNLFYYDENDVCRLDVLKASDIIDKKTNFKFHTTIFSPFYRYKKYVDRGFSFVEDKKTIFQTVINEALKFDSENEKYVKRYTIFEAKRIGKIKRLPDWYCEDGVPFDGYFVTLEIIKKITNDDLPHHQCKSLRFDGSHLEMCLKYVDVLKVSGDHKCSDELCPLNLFVNGTDHCHFYTLCPCGFPNGYFADYIFILQKNI